MAARSPAGAERSKSVWPKAPVTSIAIVGSLSHGVAATARNTVLTSNGAGAGAARQLILQILRRAGGAGSGPALWRGSAIPDNLRA